MMAEDNTETHGYLHPINPSRQDQIDAIIQRMEALEDAWGDFIQSDDLAQWKDRPKDRPTLSPEDIDKIREAVNLCYSALEDTSTYIGRLARKRLLPAWRILGVDND